MKKLNYEEVKYFIEVESNSGCKLLSTKYVNRRTKLKIQCKCDETFEVSYGTFKTSNKRQCNKCGHKKLSEQKKRPFEEEKDIIEENNPNIEVLSEIVKDGLYYLQCKCKIDGYKWEARATHLINNASGCPMCSGNVKLTLEEVKKNISKINPNIEILSNEYINNKTPLKCKCLIDGSIFYLCYSDLKNGHGCRQCYERNNKGKNNPRWNPNLTQEERERERHYTEYTQFIKDVLARDNYACKCCGQEGNGHNLRVHHLDGYNWCKEKRTDINNGVTLCEDCHKNFHSIYGYGDNTKEQYEEFINNKEKESA